MSFATQARKFWNVRIRIEHSTNAGSNAIQEKYHTGWPVSFRTNFSTVFYPIRNRRSVELTQTAYSG